MSSEGERRSVPWADEQLAAIAARDAPAVVTAGAGSGKTGVLVECVVLSILDDRIAPQEILAVTFTNKAAAEMKNRIRSRLADVLVERHGDSAQLPDHDPVVETIDAWCRRLLAANAVELGIDPGFDLLARGAETARFELRAMDATVAAMLDDDGEREALLDLLAEAPGIRKEIVEIHSRMRTAGVVSPCLPGKDGDLIASRTVAAVGRLADVARRLKDKLEAATAGSSSPGKRVEAAIESCTAALAIDPGLPDLEAVAAVHHGSTLTKEPEAYEFNEARMEVVIAAEELRMLPHYLTAARMLERYSQESERLKRDEGVLTFADVELMAVALLERRPDDGPRFRRVFVDEFQDVNPLQRRLVELVSGGSYYAVGDAAQAIYGFRGADVSLIEQRAEDLAGSPGALNLVRNYRSVEGVQEVNNHVHGELGVRGFQRLEVASGDPTPARPVELLIADCGHDEAREATGHQLENAMVAMRIRRLVDEEGVAPGDVAVLSRARSALPGIADALRSLGIAAVIEGGGGLWSRPEVDDLVALLAATGNPNDEENLLKVLHSPIAGLSMDAMVLIARRAREVGSSIWSVMLDPAEIPLDGTDADLLSGFVPWFERQRELAGRRPLADAIEAALVERGYDLHLLGLIEGQRRFANVRALQRFAANWEVANGRDPRRFADDAADLAAAERNDDDQEAVIEQEGESAGAVRLLTMHRSKGLEFDTVVIPRLGSRHVGDSSKLRVSTDGSRAAMTSKVGRQSVVLYDAELVEERSRAEDEERARLLYVAMTRAKRKLVLAGSARLTVESKDEPQRLIGPGGGASYIADVHEVVSPHLEGRLASASGASGEGDGDGDVSGWVEELAEGAAISVELDRGDALRLFEGETAAVVGGEPVFDPAPPLGSLDPPLHPVWPGNFSYSGLQVASRCRWRWYLESVVRLPLAIEEVSYGRQAGVLPARVRGVVMHALLENRKFGSRDPIAPAEAVAAAGLAQEELDAALAPQAIEAAERILGSATWTGLEEAVAAEPRSVRREEGFSLLIDCGEHGEVVLRGVFDVFQALPDSSLRVIDWKTSNHVLPQTDIEALAEAEYGIQRIAYALAGLRSGGDIGSVEVVHLFSEMPDVPVAATFGASDADRLEADLAERISSLLGGSIEPTDEPSELICSGCPAKGTICPRWPFESAFGDGG